MRPPGGINHAGHLLCALLAPLQAVRKLLAGGLSAVVSPEQERRALEGLCGRHHLPALLQRVVFCGLGRGHLTGDAITGVGLEVAHAGGRVGIDRRQEPDRPFLEEVGAGERSLALVCALARDSHDKVEVLLQEQFASPAVTLGNPSQQIPALRHVGTPAGPRGRFWPPPGRRGSIVGASHPQAFYVPGRPYTPRVPEFATALEPAPVTLITLGELLGFLPLPLVLLANLAALGKGPRDRPGWYWLTLAAVGAGVVLVGAATVPSAAGYGVGYVVGGLAMAGLALAPARRLAARILPIDPSSPLDATALGFTLVVACSQLGLQASTNVLATVASGAPETPLDQVVTELPFLLGALLGVGLGTRRRPQAVLDRLGLTVPRAWQILLGVACAGAFYAFGLGAEALQRWLTPEVAAQVGSATGRLYQGIDTPLGILTIALVPAICEETLFRGALQPRLGLVWTAITFALLHTQYGLSIDEAAVLVLAFGLGILRRVTNTTTSMLCHAIYNAITAVQFAAVLAGPGLALEGVAVVGLAVWFTASRRGARPPAL